ncbi:MAG: hypothetical protein ABIZ05_05710 [Pseudonocardiaceae bacterium]
MAGGVPDHGHGGRAAVAPPRDVGVGGRGECPVTVQEIVAAALFLLLMGAVVGWCAGWAGRGEENRAWHRGGLARVQGELAEALALLDTTRAELDAVRTQWHAPVPVAPAVVHVHVATPLPWAAHPPLPLSAARVLDAQPALPVGEVIS